MAREIIRKSIKVIFIIIMVLIVAYFGLCIYANMVVFKNAGNPSVNIPSVNDAVYEVKLSRPMRIIYTNEYDVDGSIYTIYNYWEQVGGKYIYRELTLPLDERIFGEISIKRR